MAEGFEDFFYFFEGEVVFGECWVFLVDKSDVTAFAEGLAGGSDGVSKCDWSWCFDESSFCEFVGCYFWDKFCCCDHRMRKGCGFK